MGCWACCRSPSVQRLALGPCQSYAALAGASSPRPAGTGRNLLRKLANYPSSSTENVHKKNTLMILRLGLCQIFVALPRKWSLFCGWCFKSTLGGKRQVPLTRLMILRNLDTCGFKGHHSPWRVFMLEKNCLVQLGWDHPKGFKARCLMNIKDEATFYAS